MHHRILNSRSLRRRFGFEVNLRVFLPSAGLILLAVLFGVLFHERMEAWMSGLQGWIAHYAGWFFVTVVNAILLFALYLMVSPFGKIRLGGPSAEPEFSLWAWMAMLFSAGMGIGLVFWSIAEPIHHFAGPPTAEPESLQAARDAMRLTFYHWGLHPWGIYAVVGLGLAFISYNRGLPLSVRYVFYPLFGRRVYGPLGDVIDVTAVVATLFGVATSLGLGVQQIASGLNYLFGIGQGGWTLVILITGITLLATGSVVSGLDAGIRRLSEINLVLAAGLLTIVFLAGPTLYLLNALVQNIGSYIQNLPATSTWTEAYNDTGWLDGWTIFYWGWWIAWSPFVGMFIAKISRGRTVRQFIGGVLLTPALMTFIWMTVFGNTALHMELFGGGGIIAAVRDDVAVALFVVLERFPLSTVTSLLGITVVVLFFVTSSDSGSLVIDVITAGGHTDPPVAQRIFWAVLEGLVAAVLLVGGGLVALQTAAITTGLPFAVVIVVMCIGLHRGMSERLDEELAPPAPPQTQREPPGQVTELTAPQFGRGWVVLAWEPPTGGGQVAAYRIHRRRRREETWHEVAVCLEESAALHHRESRGVWEYRVVPVNRTGEGPPSPSVAVRFTSGGQTMEHDPLHRKPGPRKPASAAKPSDEAQGPL